MASSSKFSLFLATILLAVLGFPLSSATQTAARPASPAVKGAYWPSWKAETFPPSTIPTEYFTHVFYAFLELDATTYQLAITQLDDEWMGNFTDTLHVKKPSAKAFVSIGGGNGSPYTFANMVSTSDNRAAFIKSTISVARKYDFDGIDLDWEFPNNPQDMSNLGALLSDWRNSVTNESGASGKPRLLISAAVYFSADIFLTVPPRSYPGEAIKDYVDFVSPMCFDYRGGWNTSQTGSPALIYDKSSNISTNYGISSWIKNGVPPEKLVMGMPVYGRTWQLKDPSDHGIGAPAVGLGPGSGVLQYKDIVDFNLANNATVVYDKETISTYSSVGTNWIGYDDPISIANKIKFAKEQGLGGYFFWALGFDKNLTLARTASGAWDS